MRKILITGINGFVGSNLTKELQSDHIIYGLDIMDFCQKGVNEMYLWNEISQLPEVDVVIHLAGKAHDLKNTFNEQAYYDINYGLTKIIFDWYVGSRASKFFFMSSVKGVADQVKGILTEKTASYPITAYGKSKLMAENYINSVKSPIEKTTYIFRPCMIHGPGNKGNLNLLYQLVSKRIPWPLGAFENQRSFLSIENLCFVYRELIEKDVPGGIYQLADDEVISTNELIRIISEGIGKKAKIWKISSSLIRFCAKLGSKFHLPLTEERLQKLTENYVVSNEKIKGVLKKELPVSARVGLLETILSFKKQ